MNEKIRGFDGLRAIAVILVFLHHKLHIINADLGRQGVWTFFALSGFLITGILHRQRMECEIGYSNSTTEIGRFFWRRAWRIFPVYYALLIIVTVIDILAIFGRDVPSLSDIRGIPYAYIYLSNIWLGCIHHGFDSYLTHLWSLSIEEQFYIFMAPLLLLSFGRYHMKICTFFLCLTIGVHIYLRVHDYSDWMIHTFSFNNFSILLFGGICYFVSGGLERLKWQWCMLIFICLVCIVLRNYWGFSSFGLALALIEVWQFFLTALIILSVMKNQGTIVVRMLEWPPLAYLGRVSYGFYLFHPFVPNIGQHSRLAPWFGASGPFVGAVLAFFVSFFLAHLSWVFFERKFLKMKKSYDHAWMQSIASRVGW